MQQARLTIIAADRMSGRLRSTAQQDKTAYCWPDSEAAAPPSNPVFGAPRTKAPRGLGFCLRLSLAEPAILEPMLPSRATEPLGLHLGPLSATAEMASTSRPLPSLPVLSLSLSKPFLLPARVSDESLLRLLLPITQRFMPRLQMLPRPLPLCWAFSGLSMPPMRPRAGRSSPTPS